jgi:hypothetical protein
MPKNNGNPSAVNVTPFAEIQKLTQEQAARQVVTEAGIARRAFMTIAKLMLFIETTLKPGQTLGGIVIKLAKVAEGEKRRIKSTIDNARYAMRVWKELVEPGHITEADFLHDALPICYIINRVMSGASRQKLTAADVALMLHAAPADWHEQLDCLFTYGQTLEDRAAAEAKKATAAGSTSEQSGEPTATGTTTPGESSESTTVTAESATASTGDAPEVATNIVESGIKPAAAEKPTAAEAFKLIDALEQVAAELPPAELAQVAARLAELSALLTAASTTAAPAKKSRKSKAHSKAA